MLENPQFLVKMVRRSGAHSTDLQSPEPVEHLCGKCVSYAKHWAPVAKDQWAQVGTEAFTETDHMQKEAK